MEIDVNLILNEYAKIVMELNHKVILLKVENDELKRQIEDMRKELKNA